MEKEETFQSGAGSGEMEEKKNPVTTVIVTGIGLFSALVLIFPSMVPDIIPVVGAMDEAVATTLLISCLAYFGVDIGSIFGRKKKDEDDVIDVEVQDR